MMKKKARKTRYKNFLLLIVIYLLLMLGLSATQTQLGTTPQMAQVVSAE